MTATAILKVGRTFMCCSSTDSVFSGCKSTGDSSYVQIPQVCQALLAEHQQGAILLGRYSVSDDQGLSPRYMPSFGYLTSCFAVDQDRTPLVEPSTATHRGTPMSDDGGLEANHNQDADAGKTIVRARVEHGIQVSVNPLVVPVVTLLFRDMVVNVSHIVPYR